MRKSYRSSGISRKGLKTGILLAHNTQRRNRPGQEMQDLPGACQDLTPPIRALDINHKPLAFPTMGFGHTGTCPLERVNANSSSSQWITSPSGLKPNLWPQSQNRRYTILCGEPSYAGLVSQEPWYQTTENNLTTPSSEISVQSSESRIITRL